MQRREFVIEGLLTTNLLSMKPPVSVAETAVVPCSVNVRDYGALGDGVSDDTVAVRSALNAISSSGGAICFPEGTYIVKQLLTIKSKTYLKGIGAGSVIKREGTATDSIFFSENVSDVIVESIALDMNGPSPTDTAIKSFATAIAFRRNCSNICIRNVRIYDSTGVNICCRHGILVMESREVWIENCNLSEGLRLKAGGIGDKLIVTNNIIKEANDNALTIAIPHSPSSTINYVIRNNIIQDAKGAFIYVGDDGATVAGLIYQNIVIEGNILTGTARTAMILVRLSNVTDRLHITNNILHSNSVAPHQYSAGIQTTIQTDFGSPGKDFLIEGNTVVGKFDHAGIWIQSLENCRIVNNEVSDCVDAEGIRINNLRSSILGFNIIKNCRRGIWFRDNSFDVQLNNNLIKGCLAEGILLSPGSGTDISVSAKFVANTVTECKGNGIEEAGSGPFDTHYLMNDLRNNVGNALKGLKETSTRIGNMGTDDYILRHISGTKDWSPGLLRHKRGSSTTVTVLGAKIGDTVTVGLSNPLPPMMFITGAVTSNDQVTVSLLNMSRSGVTVPMGRIRVDVWRH